jgi:hypothetical protein
MFSEKNDQVTAISIENHPHPTKLDGRNGSFERPWSVPLIVDRIQVKK